MPESNRNYIAGEWVDGPSTIENINPSDLDEIVGTYTQADRAQCLAAISAAREAQSEWAASGLEQRYSVLMAIGQEMMERSADLGELLAREEGKTLAEGKGEVYRSGQFFTYYAAESLRQIGENADSVRPGIDVDIRREPVGTVAVITPWNFPTACAAWKIAPALTFGNTVVWKPANLTPASAYALSEIISRQNLPKGVFNLVMGSGAEVGNTLINSPDVDAITFTGSLGVGRQIASAAAQNLTRIQLEMGSKNALVVMDDADMETAVQCALNGAYFGTGQKCTASSRLVVHEKVYDGFVDALTDAVKALRVGHALDESSQIGPVVDQKQLDQNLDYIKLAGEEGCAHVCGGELLDRSTRGHFMAPALFIESDNQMRVNREEMFAPIACVIKVSDYDEALAVVNDTEFGLTSGIVTQSLAAANHFKRNAKTGCVMVNLPTAGTDYHVPFGGRKNSSFGSREQGQYAKEFYTTVKTTYLRP